MSASKKILVDAFYRRDMKALVITEPGSIEVREVEVPTIGPDDVLVQSYAVGISEGDVELYQGRRPEGYYRYPVIPGH